MGIYSLSHLCKSAEFLSPRQRHWGGNLRWEARLYVTPCPAAAAPVPVQPAELACSSPQKQPEQSLPFPRVLRLSAASLLGTTVANVTNALELEASPPVCEALYVHTRFLAWGFGSRLSKVGIQDLKYLWTPEQTKAFRDRILS